MKNSENKKFYSQKSIGIATFIGSPLAAGVLIRENYINLNEFDKGRNAFAIGLASTILLFLGIFSIPESYMQKVPNQILPAIYTGIIYLIVEKTQGQTIKQHKEENGEFQSGWKAAGIGLISLVIIAISILGFAYLSTDNELYEKYEQEMKVFSENENETLKIYDEIDNKSRMALTRRITEYTIPKWEENIKIINRTNAYENLPKELVLQNEILLEYSKLRIEAFELVKKSIKEDTDKYEVELARISLEIDRTLEKIN